MQADRCIFSCRRSTAHLLRQSSSSKRSNRPGRPFNSLGVSRSTFNQRPLDLRGLRDSDSMLDKGVHHTACSRPSLSRNSLYRLLLIHRFRHLFHLHAHRHSVHLPDSLFPQVISPPRRNHSFSKFRSLATLYLRKASNSVFRLRLCTCRSNNNPCHLQRTSKRALRTSCKRAPAIIRSHSRRSTKRSRYLLRRSTQARCPAILARLVSNTRPFPPISTRAVERRLSFQFIQRTNIRRRRRTRNHACKATILRRHHHSRDP